MVLQRDVSASVWGFADVEGEVIEIVLERKVYQTTAYRGKLLGLVFIMPVVSCKIIIAYTVLSKFIVFFFLQNSVNGMLLYLLLDTLACTIA